MRSTFLILTCLALVSACGKRGSLERPDPLWGEPEAVETETSDTSERD